MIYFLCRISKLCKDYPKIRENLIRHNVISHLLDLLINSTNVRLQSAIINLLSILFRSRVDKVELKLFFNFFVQNDHLMSQFVDALLIIISGSTQKIVPSVTLTFPQLLEDLPQNDASDEWVRSRLQLNNIPSPWTRGCLLLSAFQNQLWSTGFSVSFWLKYAHSNHSMVKLAESAENQMHVISFGTDTVLLELWVEETKLSFGLRLTAIRRNNLEVHSNFTLSAPVSSSQWHLMCFSVSSEVKNDSVSLVIKVFIDGLHEDIIHSDLKKLPKNEKLLVIIGDYTTEFQSSYCVGNVMMFQSDLTKAHCLTITSYGPDLENFLPSSSSSMKVNLTSSVFVPHDIDDSIFLNVLQNHRKYTQHLQEKIILSFSPREWQHFYRYLSHGEPTKKIPFELERQITDQYLVYTFKTSVLHPVSPHQLSTFYDYILDNGGFSFVSFLLAKVVETSDCEIVHANILRFVLKTTLSNCYLHSQLLMQRGYDLISCVLSSSRFIFSQHSLIVLLEATCNQKLYWSDNIETLHFPRKVRIYNPLVITTLILPHWRRWQNCNPTLLVIFFKKLTKFVHPRNSHQIFNAEVLTSYGIVEKTLAFCREKFVGSDVTGDENCENQRLITAILDFIQFLVCLFHCEDHFRQISDFLLIMHPSSALNYQPAEGYFWSFEASSIEKLQKRFQCQHRVDDIIGHLSMTNDIDTCWNGEMPTSSVCSDIDVLNCNFNECACKGEDNECIHSVNCVASSTKKFCHQCQAAFYTILGHSLDASWPNSFLAVGLLNVLCTSIAVIPESVLNIIRRDIVNDDLLVTLINHPVASVREAVLKTVIACMSRNKTDCSEGFYILADQLALHPVTEVLVNSCVSLICPHGFSGCKSPLCPSASPPLLALLAKSVPHFPLAINILRYIKMMVKRNPHVLENLPENVLIDGLLKTILVTIHTSVCQSCREECVKDLVAESMDLFAIIVNTCLMHSTLSTSKVVLGKKMSTRDFLTFYHKLTIKC